MKIHYLLIIFCFIFSIQIFAESPARGFQLNKDISTWGKYQNSKYGYEIQYPKRLELWLTGSWRERDGRQFKIAYGDVATLHGLSVTLYPRKTLEQIILELKAPDLQTLEEGPVEYVYADGQYIYKWSKVKINNDEIIKGEYYKKSPWQLITMAFILDGVVFNFVPFGDFNESIAEKIVSSFRFYKK